MRNLLLAIPGHLGKDVGATATLESDGVGSHLFSDEMGMQQERWINLQQAVSFCLAHAMSPLAKSVEVRLVVPDNSALGVFEGGMISVLDTKVETLSLQARVDLANSMEADVVEFHSNAAPFRASGFETLCFAKEDGGSRKLTEAFRLCEAVNASVGSRLGAKVRGVKPIYDAVERKYVGREIHLLKATRNVAIITESGFMSDRGDLSKIDADLDGYNEQMGAAIWLGFQDHYSRQES